MGYADKEKQKEYAKQHYQQNKEAYKQSHKKARLKARELNKKFVKRVKSLAKCKLCGYSKSSSALEFHHKDETQKDYEISRLQSGGWSIKKIKQEMRKCVILCANCHREVHDEILNGIKHEWK